jgi:hypothetical protein
MQMVAFIPLSRSRNDRRVSQPRQLLVMQTETRRLLVHSALSYMSLHAQRCVFPRAIWASRA